MEEEQIGIVGWIVAIISVVWMVLSVVDTTAFELSKKPQSFADRTVGASCQCSSCLFEAEESPSPPCYARYWGDNCCCPRCSYPTDHIGPDPEHWTDPSKRSEARAAWETKKFGMAGPPEEFWSDPDGWDAAEYEADAWEETAEEKIRQMERVFRP